MYCVRLIQVVNTCLPYLYMYVLRFSQSFNNFDLSVNVLLKFHQNSHSFPKNKQVDLQLSLYIINIFSILVLPVNFILTKWSFEPDHNRK